MARVTVCCCGRAISAAPIHSVVGARRRTAGYRKAILSIWHSPKARKCETIKRKAETADVHSTGRNGYLSEKIWQPMGAESDASWVIDKGGYEVASAGFNATLRDYAQRGMLRANDGALDGR